MIDIVGLFYIPSYVDERVVMDFKRENLVEPLVLERRSLLVLQGEARYAWTHGIARRKSDKVNGRRLKRHRRLSVTFRKVVLDGG